MSVGPTSQLSERRTPLGRVRSAALIAAALACLIPARAADLQPEYAVKTAFIYNFLKFTQWPNGGLGKPDTPIVVCTTESDPFGNALNILGSKRVDTHPVVLERSVAAASLGKCNVIIFGGQGGAQDALGQYRARPILTIGDSAEFATSGGMIGLVNIDHQIRFQINVAAVRRSGLSVSSQLLKIAMLVDEDK